MDYLKTQEELDEYYSNTLIIQYNGKKRAKATIKLLSRLILDEMLLLQIRDAFDWRTAVGAQLDIIGKWVGVSRTYNGNLFFNQPIFSYPKSNDLVPDDLTTPFQHGYSEFSTFDTDVATGDIAELTYKNVGYVEQKLSDDNYRTVIGLKIIKNSINHTQKNIDDAIWDYFNGQVYTTWEPHKLVYNYIPDLETVMEVCFYKNVLPTPTGVEIELKVVS